MKWKCEKCGNDNESYCSTCLKCGAKNPSEKYGRNPSAGSGRSDDERYGALSAISNSLYFVAQVVIFIAVLSGLWIMAAGVYLSGGQIFFLIGSIILGGIDIFVGYIISVIIKACAEIIILLIDIESNTRKG